MTNPLAQYSRASLLAELARRENERETRRPIEHWCENCQHFTIWKGKGDPPDSYNACGMKHKMSFRMPEDYTDDFVFYRRVCADRQPHSNGANDNER